MAVGENDETECTTAVEQSMVWWIFLPRSAAKSLEHAAPAVAAMVAEFADATAVAAAAATSDEFQDLGR